MDQSNSGNQQNEGNRDLSSDAGSSGGSTPPPQSSYPPSQPSSSPSSSSSYGSDQGQGQGQSSYGSSQGGSSYSQPTQPSYTPPPSQPGGGYGGGYSQGGQQGNQYGQSGQGGQGGQYPPQNQYGQQEQYGQGGQQQYPPQNQYGQQGNQYGAPPPTNPYGQQQGYSQYNVQTRQRNSMMLPLIGLLALLLIGGGILTYFLLQPKSNNNTGVVTNPTQSGRTAVSNNTPAPGETSVAQPTDEGPGPANTGDNAGLLKSAAENMRNLRSYTLDADIDSGGQQVVMKADIFTDNSKSRMSVSTQGIDVQVITVGDQAYLSTDGGATYEEAPAASAGQMTSSVQQLSSMWDSLTNAEIDRVQDQLRDGSPATVDIDGTPTKHITGDLSALSSLGSGMGGAQDGTVDLWITTDGTNYVRRMAIDATSSGQQVKGTIDWMNFNEDFDIQAP
jgi:hypothetical protein